MKKNCIADAIMRAWTQRGWLAGLLWPLSQLFGIIVKLRAMPYRLGWLQQQKLSVPVIVVGNIFIGGTGKTPFILWMLNRLKQLGFQPGVISRGYGRRNNAPEVVDIHSHPLQVGDEPLLIAQCSACPVVVGRHRVDAGRVLLSHFPQVDVIIADDGLQHLALARDIEIMLFDSRGIGNGWLLPAGPLREPISRQRDFTVVNLNFGESVSKSLPRDAFRMQITATKARQLADETQIQEIRALTTINSPQKVIAAAGIGNPERFFTMLRQQGVSCEGLPLPDHFSYLNNPFKQLAADIILITEKDAVKCRCVSEIAKDPRIWVVVAEVDIEQDLIGQIVRKLPGEQKRGPAST